MFICTCYPHYNDAKLIENRQLSVILGPRTKVRLQKVAKKKSSFRQQRRRTQVAIGNKKELLAGKRKKTVAKRNEHALDVQ